MRIYSVYAFPSNIANESLVRRGGVHIIQTQGHKDSRWAAVQNAALPQAGERGGGKVDVGG